ncbi:MAG TPA: FmdB family zinc ribbon protein [Thermoanaerobaculia bacterium]|nr:FmdB family zinc ribbon protein [Thermoanaerobaculia bacterium]
MPLYEYQCQECAETHEVIQRMSDPAYTICPACGGALKKLISSPAIQFKGSGFYITDYGKGNSGPAKSATPAKSSEGGSSTSESKPAAGSKE